MNRGNFIVAFIALFVAISACNKESSNDKDMYQVDNFIIEGMPGAYLNQMVLDNNHVLYFVTSEIDLSEWPSSIQRRYYLSRKISETGNFEILNDRFLIAEEKGWIVYI